MLIKRNVHITKLARRLLYITSELPDYQQQREWSEKSTERSTAGVLVKERALLDRLRMPSQDLPKKIHQCRGNIPGGSPISNGKN